MGRQRQRSEDVTTSKGMLVVIRNEERDMAQILPQSLGTGHGPGDTLFQHDPDPPLKILWSCAGRESNTWHTVGVMRAHCHTEGDLGEHTQGWGRQKPGAGWG